MVVYGVCVVVEHPFLGLVVWVVVVGDHFGRWGWFPKVLGWYRWFPKVGCWLKSVPGLVSYSGWQVWWWGLVFGSPGLVWVVSKGWLLVETCSRGGFLLWVAGVVVGGGLFSWDGGGCSACSVEPQLIPRSGYFHFVLFLNFFPEAGVEFLSSIPPVLFLAGDLTKPLSRFMLCPIS